MTSSSGHEASSYDDPHNSHNSNNTHNKLIRRALSILRGQRRSTAREQALAALVASTKAELEEARRRASTAGDDVPAQVTQAMRAPKGADRLVVVYHDGMIIKGVLHSCGRRNPVREAAVWRCMRDTAVHERERRQ